MLAMQKRNVIEDTSSSDDETRRKPQRARMRDPCLFGNLGDIRECLDYFKQKPALNIIDKRLLLGVFQRQIEIKDEGND